jgi:hypothetical protein
MLHVFIYTTSYFQKICIPKIPPDKSKHSMVLVENGSFIIKCESKAKTIAPTANPISLPGQTWPSKETAQYLVKYIKSSDIGIPVIDIISGCSLAQTEKN